MLPLFDADRARAAERATTEIGRFADAFETHWLHGVRSKLGLFNEEADDRALVDSLLEWMHRRAADFTNTFRDLATGAGADGAKSADAEWVAWRERLEARRARQPQSPREAEVLARRHSPAFIPRNHKVEEALDAAMGNDLASFERLLEVLRDPYNYSRDLPDFGTPPPDARGYVTFCGT